MKNHSGGDKPETDIQQLHNKCATHTHTQIHTHTHTGYAKHFKCINIIKASKGNSPINISFKVAKI